jgi:hypothetical protein
MTEIEKESHQILLNHDSQAPVTEDITNPDGSKEVEVENEIKDEKEKLENENIDLSKTNEFMDHGSGERDEEGSSINETEDCDNTSIQSNEVSNNEQEKDVEVVGAIHKDDDNDDDSSSVNEKTAKRIRSDSVDELEEPPLPTSSLNLQSKNDVGFMESFLAVPLPYILRRTADNNSLLSSVEANLFLGITRIAYEIDALLDMSLQSIQKTKKCEHIAKSIEKSQNAFLYPMHSILHVHGIILPQKVLQTVQNELERILLQLPSVIQTLKQLAEQNWSVSNALTVMVQTNGVVNVLGKEKGNLAELEEELSRRLEEVMQLCRDDETNNKENVYDSFLESQSILNYCENLFTSRKEEDSSEPYEASQRTRDAAVTLGMLLASSSGGH